MPLPQLVVILFGAGIVLLVAELLLPTHGLLGLLGGGAILGGIVTCYRIDLWLGTYVLAGTAVAAPFAVGAVVKVWPRTPIGRRVVLQPPGLDPVNAPFVSLGQTGLAVSELRPMGMCEFETGRVEAMSEHGMIPAGRAVKVVAMSGNRPTVRAV